MDSKPQREHEWLEHLYGEWESASECFTGPDTEPMRSAGVEVVRSLGGLWAVLEGVWNSPEGNDCRTIMTLGYDPEQKQYVGTIVISMMSYLWHYTGQVDESGKKLVLATKGPAVGKVGGPLVSFHDTIEIVSPDERILRSEMLDEEGKWQPVMTARYQRR